MDARLEGAPGDAERKDAEDIEPRPWFPPKTGGRTEAREGRGTGLISKKAYKVITIVLVAVMLGTLLCYAAADGGLEDLPRYILIGTAAVSGAAAVFAARKGWKTE